MQAIADNEPRIPELHARMYAILMVVVCDNNAEDRVQNKFTAVNSKLAYAASTERKMTEPESTNELAIAAEMTLSGATSSNVAFSHHTTAAATVQLVERQKRTIAIPERLQTRVSVNSFDSKGFALKTMPVRPRPA